MAINALVELAPHDPEVKGMMEDHMARMRQSMTEAIAQAQAVGQISNARPAELITALLMTFLSGLATQLKGPLSKDEAHQLLDEQLAAIG